MLCSTYQWSPEYYKSQGFVDLDTKHERHAQRSVDDNIKVTIPAGMSRGAAKATDTSSRRYEAGWLEETFKTRPFYFPTWSVLLLVYAQTATP